MPRSHLQPLKIVTGGQTGVDRAALDVAIALQIPHGGWCPLGRLAEDGPISDRYQLREMASNNYADRTRQNVIDSDATLILYSDRLQGGSLMTRRYAEQLAKPCLCIRLIRPGPRSRVWDWMRQHEIRILNIAGPRASKEPKIYQQAYTFLSKLLIRDETIQSKLSL